ncbi:Hypothetical protein SMAX5B_003902 [Scophthalmus maximus]|uniref:Uncharacterized protein n=1 Tax=Scophthalmus maximus TaxID=52904 RepID=A0A2U9AVG4_SCOMX|nr:Hypothetical protein SMAX5B_003902 [Scophthalmus maximus]
MRRPECERLLVLTSTQSPHAGQSCRLPRAADSPSGSSGVPSQWESWNEEVPKPERMRSLLQTHSAQRGKGMKRGRKDDVSEQQRRRERGTEGSPRERDSRGSVSRLLPSPRSSPPPVRLASLWASVTRGMFPDGLR